MEKELRTFKEDWIHKYFFIDLRNMAVCLLCQETVAVFKEYNLKRHHMTKHWEYGKGMSQDDRRKKAAEYVTKLKNQQALFMKPSAIHNSATEASFTVAYNIAKHNKPFSDDCEFVEQCFVDCVLISKTNLTKKDHSAAAHRFYFS